MSWVTDFWKVVETAATLTRDVERADIEIKELRRDVNALALAVNELDKDLTHEKTTTRLVLDSFEKDGQHLKERIDSKFDVLATRLDSKIAAFENHMRATSSEMNSRPSLESGSDD